MSFLCHYDRTGFLLCFVFAKLTEFRLATWILYVAACSRTYLKRKLSAERFVLSIGWWITARKKVLLNKKFPLCEDLPLNNAVFDPIGAVGKYSIKSCKNEINEKSEGNNWASPELAW